MIELAALGALTLALFAEVWLRVRDRAEREAMEAHYQGMLSELHDRVMARDLPEFKAVRGELPTLKTRHRLPADEAAIERRRRGELPKEPA